MAKRRSQKRRRETNDFSNRRLPFDPVDFYHPRQLEFSFMREVEDRRMYHPEGRFAPAKALNGPRYRVGVVEQPKPRKTSLNRDRFASLRNLWSTVPSRIGFLEPSRVMICVRRKIREEVLHALRKTGRSGQKKPRFTEYSQISCKRRK